MTTPICPHNERVWMICWPHEDGLVPAEASCDIHEKAAWAALSRLLEQPVDELKAEGWVAVRFWLSLKKPATLF